MNNTNDKINLNNEESIQINRIETVEYLNLNNNKFIEEINIALNYRSNGNYNDCIKKLLEIEQTQITSKNEDLLLHSLIARSYFAIKNYSKAIEYFIIVKYLGLKKNINDYLGICYLKIKNFQLAIDYFLLSIKIDNNPNTKFDIGYCNMFLNKYTEAIKYYNEFCEKNIYSIKKFSIKNCILEINIKFKEKKYIGEEFKEKNINLVAYYIGYCYLKLEKFNEALNFYFTALTMGVTKSIWGIIQCLSHNQEWDYLLKFLIVIIKNVEPLCPYILGCCFQKKNNYVEAKRFYELALNKNCKIAHRDLKNFIEINKETNKYNINIDLMCGVCSLITIGTSFTENKNKRSNLSDDFENKNYKKVRFSDDQNNN